MTTMYALPALTSWNTAGGWSNTSGGASNGTYPASNTSVIFDANSGPARTITLPATSYAASLNTTGAAAMTFSGTLTVLVSNGGTINLSGSTSIDKLSLQGTYSSTNTVTVLAPNVTIGSIDVWGNCTFHSDANIIGVITLKDNSDGGSPATYGPYKVSTGGHTITCGSIYAPVPNTSATIDGGYGTWVLTGAAMTNNYIAYFDGVSWSGGGTIKFDFAASVTTNPSIFIDSNSNGNIWVVNTRSAAAAFSIPGTTWYGLQVDPGCTVSFPSSASPLTATSWKITGTPSSPITLTSTTAGSQATIAKAGGGTVYLDYCGLKDLNGSPSGAFVARSSTNNGNVSNISFFKQPPNFFSYF